MTYKCINKIATRTADTRPMIPDNGANISQTAIGRTETIPRPKTSGTILGTIDSRIHRRVQSVDPIHQRSGIMDEVMRTTEIAVNQHVYYSLDWTPYIRTHVRAK
jgi:hypothetical protein